jgi:CxxC motif-containing protein (DUF1111 family)
MAWHLFLGSSILAEPKRAAVFFIRVALLCVCCVVSASPAKQRKLFVEPDVTRGVYFGGALPGLTDAQMALYDDGFTTFIKTWKREEGLGPRFNANSCVVCHRNPLPGGGGTTSDTFVPHSSTSRDVSGGSTVSQFSFDSNGNPIRSAPEQTTSLRKSQPLFGIGLLEAVPDEVLINRAKANQKNADGVRGRLLKINGRIGRFGWKATVPTVREFVAMAFTVEMGLTSTQFPSSDNSRKNGVGDAEVSDHQIDAVSEYCRSLAAPGLAEQHSFSEEGRAAFESVGCAACHVPTLPLGAREAARLSTKVIHPYSDLLLHNMGDELSDGITEHGVGVSEFRTPPLWGLYSNAPYLHDGRAKTIVDAIQAHGGEASESVRRYGALTAEEQQALLDFLASL